jgi:hypothetical protein
MKRLDTAAISATISMPVKSGTLDFLQDAYKEALNALAVSICGNAVADVGYILFGCVNSGTGSNYIISAGAIYLNGEVYLVPAAIFTVTSGEPVGTITVSQYTTNADPVTFSDTVARNVHNIRQIVFAEAALDSSDVNFADLLNTQLVFVQKTEADLGAAYTVKFDQDRSLFFTAASSNCTIDFDFTNAIPGACVRMKWSFGASKTLTVNVPSGSNIIKDSGDLSAVASADNLLYFIYVGINENGDHEVSYTLKQY